MEIRERFAGLFFIIPFAVSLLLHTLTDIDFFFFLSLALAVVSTVFHHQLYLLFLTIQIQQVPCMREMPLWKKTMILWVRMASIGIRAS